MPTITTDYLKPAPTCRPHRLIRRWVYNERTRRTEQVLVRELDRDRMPLEHLEMRDLFGAVTGTELGLRAALAQMRVGGPRQRGSEIDSEWARSVSR